MAEDNIKNWIRRVGSGKSMVDIGGIGEDSGNERVSDAVAAGASRVAMADIQPFTSNNWAVFRDRMATLRVSGYSEYECVDIRNIDLPAQIPAFDIVHCTGIVYHLPDPVMGVYNLSRIAQRWLIINTVILPDMVENEHGRIVTEGSRVMFLPALSAGERKVLRLHYSRKFGWDLNDGAPLLDAVKPLMPYLIDGGPSPWPYWWLFSAGAFRSLVRMMGFKVRDEWLWEGHALALLCEKG